MKNLSFGKGIFANPKADSVFKTMFGTPKYKALTISLINSIIPDLNVVNVEFPSTEIHIGVKMERKSVIDVLCTLDSGERVIIEMQNAPQAYFTHRMVFYTSHVIATLDGQYGAEWDYNFHNTYVIAFLNFTLPESLTGPLPATADCIGTDKGKPLASDDVICNFKTINSDSGAKLPGGPEYYFVQLPKFKKSESELHTVADFWLYSLIEAQDQEVMPESIADETVFSAFYDGLLRANFTQDQELKYINDMTTQRDINNQIKFAQDQGYAEGTAETLLAVARNLKKIGRPFEEIAQCTGLSVEEIAALSVKE